VADEHGRLVEPVNDVGVVAGDVMRMECLPAM